VRKLTRELEQVRHLDNETLTIGDMMLILLTIHIHPLMKALMMRKEELEEGGIQEMTLGVSKLRH